MDVPCTSLVGFGSDSFLIVVFFFFKLSYLFLTLDVTLLFLSRTGHQAALAEACRGIVGIGIKTVTWQMCG